MAIKSDQDSTPQTETETNPGRIENVNEEEELNAEKAKDNEEVSDDDGLPIDRGWAWMILAGCFLNATLTVGYNRTLSLFFVEFLEMFKASAATTTLIMGVKSLSFSLFSLVTMHVLLEFLGTRRTVLLGGTIYSAAVLSASFAPNIAFLICVHFILGIGHSMIRAPGVVLISKYFKKRRSLATATASSAISFSSGVFPLLAEYLLYVYGVRGAMLIISGLTMNMWVGASLFRPLEYYKRNKKTQISDKEETQTMLKDHDHLDIEKNSTRYENLKINGSQTCPEVNANGEVTSPLSRSLETCAINYLSPENDEQFRRRTYSEGSKHKHCASIDQSEKLTYARNPDFINVSVVDIQRCCDQSDPDRKEKVSPLLRNIRKILNAFDFSLFKKPMFLLIAAFSHVSVVLRLAQIYLPARVNELGFDQSDAALLLLITGILDFFCRIFYGFLADLKFLKVHHIMAIGLFMTGLATQFMAFYTTFPLLITYAVLNGIFGSAYDCLLPVVIVEFMGIEYMAKTLGFVALFQGFAIAVTHPIIGGIRDLSGSYVACYYYMGTSSLLAAGLLMCEPLVRKYVKKKPSEEKEGNDSG